jgi:hypothetical protein
MKVLVTDTKIEVDLTDATDLQKQYWSLMSQLIENGLGNPTIILNLLCTMSTGLTLNEVTNPSEVTISTILASIHFLLHLGGGPKLDENNLPGSIGPESSGGTLDDFFKDLGDPDGNK